MRETREMRRDETRRDEEMYNDYRQSTLIDLDTLTSI